MRIAPADRPSRPRIDARTATFVVALAAVVLGCVARFDGLGNRLFWEDEVFSMMRVTGHVEHDLYRLFDGRVHDARQLVALDRLDPKRGFGATMTSLAEEPQRGPLFYLLARAWADIFGDGIARVRALSAFVGIAAIGFGYLLGRRMTRDPAGGAILAALVALSPVEVRYSGQVREYAALATITLACSWLFLRASEGASALRWATYALAAIVGFFISPIFGAAVLAHGIVAVGDVRRRPKLFLAWLASAVVAGAVFLPYLLHGAHAMGEHSQDLAWLYEPYPLASLAAKWAFNVGAIFFDAELAHRGWSIVLVPIGAFVGCAVVGAFRGDAASRRGRVLALATTFVPIGLIVANDVAVHAHYEAVTRYLMSAWVGIDMLVAIFLSRMLAATRARVRTASVAGLVFFVACGLVSAAVARSYGAWWDDNEHLDERLVGHAIVATAGPEALVAGSVVLSARSLVLSHYLPPSERMLLYGRTLPPIPAGASPVFLFLPERSVLARTRERLPATSEIRNVSPGGGVAIPNLVKDDGAAADPARADNALYEFDPRAGSAIVPKAPRR